MFAAEIKTAVLSEIANPPAELRICWKDVVEVVEPFLETVASRLSDQVKAFESAVVPYAEYALTTQGKQLRPALVALSGNLAEAAADDLVSVAVIIEMVHLATLVHDDVIDAAEMRRQRPTLAATWGNELSVLLGDCLFAHALKLAASFPTPEICRAVASATNTVCSGEILQIQKRGKFPFSRAEYFQMLGMKTATLFSLSCDLGAALSRAKPGQRAALRQFGWSLGTAYQVFDDCLDLFGTEAVAGKSLGNDLANGKVTLPVLVALERAKPADQARLMDRIQAWDPSSLLEVLELLEHYQALTESRRVVHEYLASARQNLSTLEDTDCRSALVGLTEYLAQQTDALGVISQ
jgi:octaprenyl-diphosphate synthase